MNDRTVLVTGGSRGIGAAIVRRLVAAGDEVCFTWQKDERAATALLEELRARGGTVHAIQGDVADPEFAPRCFDTAGQLAHAPIAALVNNAGITGRHGAFTDLPVEVMRRTFDVNVLGTMTFSQVAVRRWRAAGVQGRIVNLSSGAATLGSAGEYVHYAASKAAIDTFTIGLGREVAGDGIRVNAVAPGTVYTDIHAAGGAPDRPARVVSRVPLKRIGEPDEIAAAVAWLLSGEASYVTATVLRVAGGL